MTTEYIPGTCNIGAGEIRQRQFVAAICIVLFMAASIFLFVVDASRSARLALFFQLVVASIGWVQSRKKFCLAYGFMVTFNFGKVGQLSKVSDKGALRAYLITALKILAQSLLYAVLITAVVYLIPA